MQHSLVSRQVMYHTEAVDHSASPIFFGTVKVVVAVELDQTTRPATEHAV